VIGTLLRQDPAFRGLPFLVLAGVVFGSILRAFAATLPGDPSAMTGDQRGWTVFALAVAWICCLFVVLSVNFMTRASRLAMSLPVRGRTVWWSRMASILYSGLVPIGVATVVGSLRVTAGGTGVHLDPFFLMMGGKAAAALVLAAFLFQSPQPQLQRVRPSIEYAVYVVVVSALILLFMVTTPIGPSSILVPLVLAAALSFRLHRTVPDSFLLFPTEPEGSEWEREARIATVPDARGTEPTPARPGAESVPESSQYEVSPRRLLHGTLSRLLVHHWQMWIFAPMITLYGFLVVFDGYARSGRPLPNLLFLMAWPLVEAFQGIFRLYRVDHLPISRRVLFPYVALPGLLFVVLGMAIGAAVVGATGNAQCQVCYGDRGIIVEAEFWEIARDGRPPEIGSPWGESIVPTAHPIYPGSGAALYLPYETTDAHSDRFAALQANRAMGAAHGDAPYTEQEIAAAAESHPLIAAMARRHEIEGEIPVEDSIGRGSAVKFQAWMLGAAVAGWLLALGAGLGFAQYLNSRFRLWYKASFIAGIVVWSVLLLGYVFGDLLGRIDPRMIDRLPFVLLRHVAEAIPLGTIGIAILVLLSFLGSYMAVEWVFRRIEAPLGRVKPVWKEYG
jgi:hypothetical protein